MDIDADLAAMRQGHCWYDRTSRRIWINGRLYEQKPHGTLFPVRGDGFEVLDRDTYKALIVIRQYNGDMSRALNQINRDPVFTDAQRDEAVRIWHIRERAKRARS